MVNGFHVLMVAIALFCNNLHAAPNVWQEPVTGMPFVGLAKGCFQMGTRTPVKPHDERGWKQIGFTGSLSADEQPQHEVCVDAFLIGQYEVRASDWQRVMGVPPPHGKGAEPASGMDWHAAQEFASKLTGLAQRSGARYRFRLPTEAEWEYACRAGAKTESVPGREERLDVAWYSVNKRRTVEPAEVGKLKPNEWGLYDILGNVWEWTADAYREDAYAKHALYNPVNRPAQDAERVIRGASHRSDFLQVRCGNRSSYAADAALDHIGLRLVRTE